MIRTLFRRLSARIRSHSSCRRRNISAAPIGHSQSLETRRLPAAATAGVLRGTTLYLDSNGDPAHEIDTHVAIGNAQVVVGRWNGEFDTVAYVRTEDGLLLWDIDDNGDMQPDRTIQFGAVNDLFTDTPVVGDWNGNGTDQAGVYRNYAPHVHRYPDWIRDMGAPGYQDSDGAPANVIQWGLKGDLPIVGNFDDDPADDFGVARDGRFVLDSGEPGWQGEDFSDFATDGIPIAMDTDGDGRDEYGGVTEVNVSGTQLLRWSLSDGTVLHFGKPGDRPIAGDWHLPEINITNTSDNSVIFDGDSGTRTISFGTTHEGYSGESITFRVHNSGTADLIVAGLDVPDGFAVTEGLRTRIAAGMSDEFTIQLTGTTDGTFSGDVQVLTNDANETPFTYRISGVVHPTEFVNFQPVYGPNTGVGFHDPEMGAVRREAFEHALSIWSRALVASYPGETIVVAADMRAGRPGTLASAGPVDFVSVTASGELIAMGVSEANHALQTDVNGARPEILVTYNLNYDTDAGSPGFYYGLDRNAGSSFDFITVSLHEIAHGLGFLSLFTADGTSHQNNAGDFVITPYDRFAVGSNGARLADLGQTDRASAVRSNNVFWAGAEGIAGNSSQLPKLHAPQRFAPGSSISHLEEHPDTHGDELLSSAYSGPDHTFSAVEIGMLADLGWRLQPGTGGGSLGSGSLRYSEAHSLPGLSLNSPSVTVGGPAYEPEFAWNVVPGADSYEVVVENAESGEVVLHVSDHGTPRIVPELGVGRYALRVRAIGPDAVSAWSDAVIVETVEAPLPKQPLVSISGHTGEPVFTWHADTAARSYEVVIRTADGNAIASVSESGDVTLRLPQEIGLGEYHVTVRGINAQGRHGVFSSPVTVQVSDATIDARAARIRSELGLKSGGRDYYNWAGMQERWVQGREAWYFVTPDGSLHHWSGTASASPSAGVIAALDSRYYSDLNRFHQTATGGQQILAELDARLQFETTHSYSSDWAGKQEKWLHSATDGWFFLTPDGSLYRWNPSSGRSAEGTLEATVDPAAHRQPKLLHEASRIHTDRQLSLQSSGNYYRNWGGRNELWLTDGERWYFLTEEGDLFLWDSAVTDRLTGELVAQLDSDVWTSPELLHTAYDSVFSEWDAVI